VPRAKTEVPGPKGKRYGPYSLSIQRGAIGNISGWSLAGKFIRRVEAELIHELGGAPTFAQKLLIRRIARMTWQLDQFDQRFEDGTLTEYDTKMVGGLTNGVRLSLVALGLKGKAAERRSSSPLTNWSNAASPDHPRGHLEKVWHVQSSVIATLRRAYISQRFDKFLVQIGVSFLRPFKLNRNKAVWIICLQVQYFPKVLSFSHLEINSLSTFGVARPANGLRTSSWMAFP
jgi:hypothetical protein